MNRIKFRRVDVIRENTQMVNWIFFWLIIAGFVFRSAPLFVISVFVYGISGVAIFAAVVAKRFLTE